MNQNKIPKTASQRKRIANSISVKINLMICITVIIIISILSTINYITNYNSVYGFSTEKSVTGTNILASALSGEEDVFITDKTEYLDGLKADTGLEYTIFQDDTRLYTTVVSDGERAVGTQLSETIANIVIEGKEPYIGEAEILGVPHLCSYVPYIDSTGEVVGVLFSGVRIDQITPQLITNLIINVGVGVLILVISTIISIMFIGKNITNPIRTCANRLKLLAEGDIKSPMQEIVSNDEIGVLAQATGLMVRDLSAIILDVEYMLTEMANGNFNIQSGVPAEYYSGDFEQLLVVANKIRDSLSDTLSQINIASEQVNSGSEQVSSGAQSLAQGATQQAASVEELSSVMSQTTEKIRQTTADSQEARAITLKATNAIADGDVQMRKMVDAMATIEEKSNEVSKIIKAIDDIAFQTNILSLNAAVEAARAGQAGKGFAVVAEEVRNLATKSAQSAKETAALIEQTVIAVNEGAKTSEETTNALNTVDEVVKQITVIVDNIALSAQEQMTGVEQINNGMQQISEVVQTNSATAEESAAASEELSGQANMLKGLVGQFTLNNSIRIDTTPKIRHSIQSTEFLQLDDGKY